MKNIRRLIIISLLAAFLFAGAGAFVKKKPKDDKETSEDIPINIVVRLNMNAKAPVISQMGPRIHNLIAKQLQKRKVTVVFRPWSLPGEYELILNVAIFDNRALGKSTCIFYWIVSYKDNNNRLQSIAKSAEDIIHNDTNVIQLKALQYIGTESKHLGDSLQLFEHGRVKDISDWFEKWMGEEIKEI